jgi:tryptophan-rich sensory protein
LTEENLSSKMTEFMTALDQVKAYRELVSAMADFVIIIVASVAALLTANIVVNLLDVFYGYGFVTPGNSGSLPFFNFLILFFGVIIGVLWVRQKLSSVRIGEWKNILNEGTPGAIKLLQETNWEKIFSDIRSAKLGFALYGAVKILAYWLVATFLFIVLSSFMGNTIHLSFDPISLTVIPLILVLILSVKDLRYRYEQVGRLDSLLWELRWFDNEFRRADFQA